MASKACPLHSGLHDACTSAQPTLTVYFVWPCGHPAAGRFAYSFRFRADNALLSSVLHLLFNYIVPADPNHFVSFGPVWMAPHTAPLYGPATTAEF